MSGFQIFLGRAGSSPTSRPVSGTVDLIVDGLNLTARVGESQVLPFLRDLTHAVIELATGRRARATVPFYLREDPWELGLQRDGDQALISLFRGGQAAEVAIHERAVRLTTLLDELALTLEQALGATPGQHHDLVCARDMLASVTAVARGAALGELFSLTIEPPPDAPLAFGCELQLRPGAPEAAPAVARSDLFPLLVTGRLRLVAHGHVRDLGETYPFLVAERLVELAEQALEATPRAAAFHRRFEVARLRGVLRSDGTGLALTLRRVNEGPENAGDTFPGHDARGFAQAVVALGRSLGKTLARNDRTLSNNLRLSAFRGAVKRLAASLKPRTELTSRLNDAPESYRAYALSSRKPAETPSPMGLAKLRFAPRWEATVPGLDLGGTFLCGDRLVATGSRELAALSRATGEVLWTRAVQRAVAVPTPGGLARIHQDGQLVVHDYGSGEPTLTARLAPKLGGPAAGAVVHSPGLPRLLVVTEGERHLSAVDLISGEIRWRHTLSRIGACKLRRAGRLLLECSGDTHLTAIDVQSGEVVWRLCSAIPFCSTPGLDGDSVFAIAGDADAGRRGKSRLFSLDAWSGAVRFEASLPHHALTAGQPLLTTNTVAIVTRDDRGTGLTAFDRASGMLRYTLAPGLAPLNSAWLAVDDALFASTDQGELLSLDAATGEERFRLALCAPPEDGIPRKLDPVLRSGALFVPQREVYVVRPRDGQLLGQVPSDLIPDMLRVDERCDVYLGEESGHLAAFGAAPRLALVKG
jgi:outer membrane protein assembly factor BamB